MARVGCSEGVKPDTLLAGTQAGQPEAQASAVWEAGGSLPSAFSFEPAASPAPGSWEDISLLPEEGPAGTEPSTALVLATPVVPRWSAYLVSPAWPGS